MAIPSGSGTEVLKSLNYVGVDNATWRDLLGSASGTTALHIYTVLSIIITDQAGSGNKVARLRTIDADGSSNSTILFESISIPANGNFVFNDKFVVTGGTRLQMIGDTSGANFNVWCSYIDQNWED